jgi:hypothetical protein
MGMSTYVLGIRPADDTYRKMLAVWEACQSAKVKPPKEVADFFANIDPDPAGVVVGLAQSSAVTKWQGEKNEAAEGFEVDLRKLDPTIKILRFVNSW